MIPVKAGPDFGVPWLAGIKREAFERFQALGFPTTRDEDWKYTNTAPIARTVFHPPDEGLPRPDRDLLDAQPFARFDCPRLVFVNARYAAGLSSLDGLPEGCRVASLAEALDDGDERVENHLARYARWDQHAFVAVNTASLEDGAFVDVPAGVVAGQPIHLLFVSTTEDRPTVCHPRVLILAGQESQAAIIESYITLGGGAHFTNAVTEIVAGERSVIDHYKIQHEREKSFHVATLQVYQGRDSAFQDYNVSLGGKLARNDVNAVMDAEGAGCSLHGLYVAHGKQHVDYHTALDHAKPHCNSREIYKGILAGSATGVFNGKIIVRKDAQKTDAIQSNKNLLLSESAVINTKPQLEIFADDVRCTHGATVGQLDAEAMFYLRTRGIDQRQARRMLVRAFAEDVLHQMKAETVRRQIEDSLPESWEES